MPPGFRAVGAAVVRDHPQELNPMTANQGNSPDQDASRDDQLLIRQDIGVSKAGGIVNDDAGFL